MCNTESKTARRQTRAFRPAADAMEERRALTGLNAALAHSAPVVAVSTTHFGVPNLGGGLGATGLRGVFVSPVARMPAGVNFGLANAGRNPGSSVFPTNPGTSTAPTLTVNGNGVTVPSRTVSVVPSGSNATGSSTGSAAADASGNVTGNFGSNGALIPTSGVTTVTANAATSLGSILGVNGMANAGNRSVFTTVA